MKVINLETGFLAYQKIFSNLQANNCPLKFWQNNPVSGTRDVTESHLNSFHMESKLLHINLLSSQRIDTSLPLFCYSEEGQLIFKTSVSEVRENFFSARIPPEIKFLEDPERANIKVRMGVDLDSDVMRVKRLNLGLDDCHISGYMKVKRMSQRTTRDQEYLKSEFEGVTLDEEDKLFASKRESPRARPKNEKWVSIRLSAAEDIHKLKLFDLSQGGMGFTSFDIGIFPKGLEVYLLGVDSHVLDDPLIGKVVSHRPIDDDQSEWKVGVKFDEGQD